MVFLLFYEHCEVKIIEIYAVKVSTDLALDLSWDGVI